jgi:hypothetical protein
MIGTLVNVVTDRLSVLVLVVATLFALLMTYFCVAQAITVAWLASFVDEAARLEQMRAKFWVFAVAAGVLVLVDALLFAVWGNRIRRVRAARRRELMD